MSSRCCHQNKQKHGEKFLESLWVPRFWEPICAQGKRLTAPEVQKKSVEQHAWKSVPGRKVWVDGVSHPHSSYPILWRIWTMFLIPAAPHKGALWLKEGTEAVEPPGSHSTKRQMHYFSKSLDDWVARRRKVSMCKSMVRHGSRWSWTWPQDNLMP